MTGVQTCALPISLRDLIDAPELDQLGVAAARYAHNESLYRMPEAVVNEIEQRRSRHRDGRPAFAGCVDSELAGLSRALPRLEDWLGLEGQEFRRTRDRRTLRFEHGGRGYYLKAHFGLGWREILKNLFQLKLPVLDAGNEWRATHLVKALGLPTMDAVACGVGRGLARRKSFIVTRELSGMLSLEQFAEREGGRDDAALRRALVRKVANTARTLHGNGINHRDFYLCHFLFAPPSAGRPPGDLHLIDLHRAQVRRRTPKRWRVKDLGALYYSALGAGLTRRDRLRFIKAYSGSDSLRRALGDRSFWTRVEKRAWRLKRAEERRGYADAARAAKHLN